MTCSASILSFIAGAFVTDPALGYPPGTPAGSGWPPRLGMDGSTASTACSASAPCRSLASCSPAASPPSPARGAGPATRSASASCRSCSLSSLTSLLRWTRTASSPTHRLACSSASGSSPAGSGSLWSLSTSCEPCPSRYPRGRQPLLHRDRIAARWLRRSACRRRCCGGTVNSPGSATHSRQAPCGCCSPGQPGTVAKLLGLRILLRAVAGPEVDPSTNGLGSYCCGGLGARTRPPQGSVRTMARSVHPTCHNPNIPPPATPLVNGPLIRLPGHHGKVRRDGYRADRT